MEGVAADALRAQLNAKSVGQIGRGLAVILNRPGGLEMI